MKFFMEIMGQGFNEFRRITKILKSKFKVMLWELIIILLKQLEILH